MTAALKKRPANPEPNEPRERLRIAIEVVKAAEEAIDACRREQQEARSRIHLLRADIERAQVELEETPALERKPKRAALAGKREDLEDLQQHLIELQRKEGEGSMPPAGSLSWHLEQRKLEVQKACAVILQAHKPLQARVDAFIAARATIQRDRETLLFLAKAGVIPPEKRNWDHIPAGIERVDPAVKAAVEGLLVNPDQEIPE